MRPEKRKVPGNKNAQWLFAGAPISQKKRVYSEKEQVFLSCEKIFFASIQSLQNSSQVSADNKAVIKSYLTARAALLEDEPKSKLVLNHIVDKVQNRYAVLQNQWHQLGKLRTKMMISVYREKLGVEDAKEKVKSIEQSLGVVAFKDKYYAPIYELKMAVDKLSHMTQLLDTFENLKKRLAIVLARHGKVINFLGKRLSLVEWVGDSFMCALGYSAARGFALDVLRILCSDEGNSHTKIMKVSQYFQDNEQKFHENSPIPGLIGLLLPEIKNYIEFYQLGPIECDEADLDESIEGCWKEASHFLQTIVSVEREWRESPGKYQKSLDGGAEVEGQPMVSALAV